MSLNVLAIHDGHNASVALFQEGKITYALSEERLTRVKNQGGFPAHAFQRVLNEAGVSPEDLDRVVLCNSRPLRREWVYRDLIMKRYGQYCTAAPGAGHRFRRKAVEAMPKSLVAGLRKALKPGTQKGIEELRRERLDPILAAGVSERMVAGLDHHLCHAAGAYYAQGEFQEPVLCLTCDGGGDGICASVWIGERGRLKRVDTIPVDDSIAKLYALITYMLGLVPLEHEYKVMGLAPYADMEKAEEVAAYLGEHFAWAEDDTRWKRREGLPPTSYWYDIIQRKTRFQRFDVVAAGFQRFIEQSMVRWVRAWIRKSGLHKIALSGGIFMNVKLNKTIMELDEVESICVLPSCGDESNPIGGAYLGALSAGGDPFTFSPLRDLYLGPNYSKEVVQRSVQEFEKKHPVRIEIPVCIELHVAELLAQGQVVARYEGREEFGARALGNRSILADPARLDIIREINKMIKCRDFWMPFAGTMTTDQARRNLLNPKNVKAPYMIMAFASNGHYEEYHAATHPYDRTMRPQILEEDWNPSYYRILKEFERLTGRKGGLLNTSFNLHGYPIVSSPEDALDVFARSGLTHMAMGHYLITKIRSS